MKRKIPIWLFLFSTALFAVDPNKILVWKPIQEANGYQVQIKDKSGKLVIDAKTSKNFFPIESLPPGDYQTRTAPLNLFQKPAVWSLWRELEIVVSEPPKILVEAPKTILLPKENSEKNLSPQATDLTIKGENFLDATEVQFRQQKQNLPILKKEVKGSSEIAVSVNTTQASPGPYDLSITNPYQKEQIISNYLRVEKTDSETQPLKKQSPSSLSLPTSNLVAEGNPSLPEIKLQPNQRTVKVPQGKPFAEYTYEEMLTFLSMNVDESCRTTKVPAFTLSECHKTYVLLNFNAPEGKSVFEFYKLISTNQNSRLSAYRYFSGQCSPRFRPAWEKMELDWKNSSNLDQEERSILERELRKIRTCVS